MHGNTCEADKPGLLELSRGTFSGESCTLCVVSGGATILMWGTVTNLFLKFPLSLIFGIYESITYARFCAHTTLEMYKKEMAFVENTTLKKKKVQ